MIIRYFNRFQFSSFQSFSIKIINFSDRIAKRLLVVFIGLHLLYFVVKNHPFIDGNKRPLSRVYEL
ncbi:Fic family protein [Desulfobacter latus]|uniref:Fic family protein n=1 Tax=Desulfobacter latus TaxID=2292 RepID=A0A850TAM4_9BACT|nr:Fic family protein [Desulfobacter latus]